MNPLRLEIENLGVLRDVTLDLPEGLVGILGRVDGALAVDSNGAGKTTLVNAIVSALFGPDSAGPGRPTFAQDITRGEDHMRVLLVFEHAGEIYRVRRDYTARTRAATLDLEKLTLATGLGPAEDAGFEPLTRASIAETQEFLEQILGFTRQTFLASVFIGQEDGCFADGTAKQAKQLLTEAAFGRDPAWARYAAAAGEERRAVEAELDRLDGRTETARAIADTRAVVETERDAAAEREVEAADEVADRERAHQALAQRWQAAREQAARRQAAEAELAAARAELDRLQRLDAAATEAVVAAGVTRDELDALPGSGDLEQLNQRIAVLEAAVAEHERQQRDHEEGKRAAASAEAEIAGFEHMATNQEQVAVDLREKAADLDRVEDPHCQTCGQPVADDAKARAIAAYIDDAILHESAAARNRADAAKIAIPDIPPAPLGGPPLEELAAAKARVRTLVDAAAQRARLEERLVALQKTIAERPAELEITIATQTCTDRVELLDLLAPVDVAAIERDGVAVKQQLDTARVQLDAARTARARCEERLAQVAAAEQQLQASAGEREQLARRLTILRHLETGCGHNGVPTLILETAVIPFVETETQRVLTELGAPFHVELRTQREKRDGGLSETLDVVIVTDTGDECPYRKLSGGEKMRVSIALRAAVGRLAGARSGLLVIDEPRWLDQSGVDALLESLRGLRAEFSRIYVVTQSGTTLRDSFDEVLTVTKGDDGRSTIDVGVLLSEAAA